MSQEVVVSCFICGSKNVSYLSLISKHDPNRKLNVISCNRCGYQRNKNIKSESDAIKIQSHFDGSLKKIKRKNLLCRESIISRKIDKITSYKFGSILDIGCNDGCFLENCNNNWVKDGIELSATLSKIAKKRQTIHNIYTESVEGIDLHKKYDVVTIFAVIEHIYDPDLIIKKINSILKAGGLLVLMTGDRDSKVAKEFGNDWPLYISPDHISYFNSTSIKVLLERNGFEITEIEWRYLNFVKKLTFFSKIVEKIRDLLSKTQTQKYDACYIYARKIIQ